VAKVLRNTKNETMYQKKFKKLQNEEYIPDAKIPSKPNIEIKAHLSILKPPWETTKYQMNSLTL